MNSADIAKRRAPDGLTSLAELQTVVGQVEETLGPLVLIENDGTDTFFSFDEGRDTPATLVVLEPDVGQASPRAGVDEFVTRGVCIIAGAPVPVAAYRAGFRGVQTVSNEIPPEGRALLDTIATDEAKGYDVIYGGGKFTDFSHHPNIPVPIRSGPHKRETSSAAGRYQFLFSTWTQLQNELYLPDFSPASQDKAAWHLAQTVYRRRENRDLLSDLENEIYDKVGPALHGTWTSLPGGIEQGVNANRFETNYTRNLAKYQAPPLGSR
jgi:muramidase (phage lysozyme)